MRLFAAISLPSSVEERLMQLRLRLAVPKDGLRWSEPEQWHVTLRFFGDVDDAMASALRSALRRVEGEAPEISIEKLGLFPAKGILYAAVTPSPELMELQAKVERLASAAGLLPETRAFHPHITLARSRNRTGINTLTKMSRPALPSLGPELRWRAEEAVLFRSELAPTGAVYEVIERFPLRAAEGA